MKILIAGELPFIDEVERLCRRAAHDVRVFLVEDFLGAVEAGYELDGMSEVEIAIELHNESAAAKQELLLAMGTMLPDDALILTSCLATSATQAASDFRTPANDRSHGLKPVFSAGLPRLSRKSRAPTFSNIGSAKRLPASRPIFRHSSQVIRDAVRCSGTFPSVGQ